MSLSKGVVYRDLKNKCVLVTGGGSGLGYAIADGFVRNGARVVIIGRNGERLKRAARTLGKKAFPVEFDLAKTESLPELVRHITQSVGEIDVLVNNAGVNLKKDALAVTDREYRNLIEVNQNAVFVLSREVARKMIVRKSGVILMVSSMASQYGIPRVVGYTAAKSAVEGMTRAMAVEWSPRGIRVNCIAPGFIKTAMSSDALDDDPERKKRVLARTPAGRLGEPSDVASAALFLASDEAKYITGIVLPVDGGNSIGF